MDETLKSLRSIHITLVAVAAVTILVSFTSQESRGYDRAISDLRLVKQLSYSQYSAFTVNALARAKKISQAKAMNDFASQFKRQKMLMLHGFEGATLFPCVAVPNQYSKIRELRTFFRGPDKAGFYRPIAAQFAKIVATDFAVHSTNGFALGSRAILVEYKPFLESIGQEERLPHGGTLLVASDLPPRLEGYGTLYFLHPHNNTVQQRIAAADAVLDSYPSDYAAQWIRQRGVPISSDAGGSSSSLLVATSRYPDIDFMTIDDAIAYLSDKRSRSEDSFSILGQSIAGNLIGLLAPATICIALLLLTSYQRTLIANFRGEAAWTPFPWIGVAQDKTSRYVYFVSVTAGPILALALCLFFLNATWALRLYNSAAIVVAVALCLAVVRDNRSIHRLILGKTTSA